MARSDEYTATTAARMVPISEPRAAVTGNLPVAYVLGVTNHRYAHNGVKRAARWSKHAENVKALIW